MYLSGSASEAPLLPPPMPIKQKKLELETNQPSSPSLLEASEDGQQ